MFTVWVACTTPGLEYRTNPRRQGDDAGSDRALDDRDPSFTERLGLDPCPVPTHPLVPRSKSKASHHSHPVVRLFLRGC
jgi:hypothetical protein